MGTPLVLVPGMLCDATVWDAQVRALGGDADCLVADATRDGSVAGMADRILAEVPFERFALAGFSMGGYVALEMLHRARERIIGLALLATSARTDTPERREERRRFIELANSERTFAPITRTMLSFLVAQHRLTDGALAAQIVGMAANVGREAYIRQQTAILGRADHRETLRAAACPTLILCGRADDRTPVALHEEMAALVPGAQFSVIEDCGHMLTLEAPAEVNRHMVRWLATVP